MTKSKVISFTVSAILALSVLAACSSNTANNQTGSPAGNTTDSSTDSSTDNKTDGNSAGSTGTGSTTDSTADIAAEPQNKYVDGVYDGTGTGKEAGILVHVTIKGDKITVIKVIDYHDTPDYFEEAAAAIIPAIISSQSTEVETVSGCTYSSKGIIQAVSNALSKALAK